MDVINWFAAPLQHEFMVKAIFVSALVGMVCAALSCYILHSASWKPEK